MATYAITEPTAKVVEGTLSASTPTIAGAAVVGHSLTVASGDWTTGATIEFQWLADGSALEGATEATLLLTPELAGKTISAQVTGAKLGYMTETRVSESTIPVEKLKLSAGKPTVTGDATVGQTLSVDAGNWTPETSFEYQWLADGVPVAGAAGTTLVLTADQVGKAIASKVTGAKPGYTPETRTSEPTTNVEYGTLTVGTPVISGETTVGETLSVELGEWTPGATFEYQWLADGAQLAGATGSTLTLGSEHVGQTIAVQVAGSNPGYIMATTASASTPAVAKYSLIAPTPAITGTPKAGHTLSADVGTWSPAPVTLRYQWYRSGLAIIGATTDTLQLTADDVGAPITLQVTGSKPDHTTASRTSAATAAVAKGTFVAVVPAVTGTVRVGQTLAAEAGAWSPSTAALRYQWYRSGAPIAGATDSTLQLTTDDVGSTFVVRVTGSQAGYITASTVSAATPPVAEGVLGAAVPTVSGSAVVGYTLSVDTGTWSPAPVAFRYQWYRGGVAVFGATEATYRISGDDAGAPMTVQVTGSQLGYSPDTRTSEPTANVVHEAFPSEVTFADLGGTARDTYTVPATDGVDYRINGEIMASGSYPGAGTVTATATAKAGYVLAPDVLSSWTGNV